MTARLPAPRRTHGPPRIIAPRRTEPDRPAVPNVRQLWLADPGSIDRARDVVRVTDVGRQLLADEPARLRRLAARLDWGAALAVLSVVVLAVVIALAVTGGYR